MIALVSTMSTGLLTCFSSRRPPFRLAFLHCKCSHLFGLLASPLARNNHHPVTAVHGFIV